MTLADLSLEEAIELLPPYAISAMRGDYIVSSNTVSGNQGGVVEIRSSTLPPLSMSVEQYELFRTDVLLAISTATLNPLRVPHLTQKLQSLIRGAFSGY